MEAEKNTNVSEIEDGDGADEEPGEVIESAPPLKVGEEREIDSLGLKKKLIKQGHGWESPNLGDEVTVHYVGKLTDGSELDSTRDKGEPITMKLGQDQVVTGLDHGIITMKRGEVALFTLTSDLGYGSDVANKVPPNSILEFEVELISWIAVVDVCRDGGIIKKVLKKGTRNEQPGDLDEVMVKYDVMLNDGTVVASTPNLEFYIKDGHLCPALPKAVKTMKSGEHAKLIVQPKYAFGEHGLEAKDGCPAIPSDSIVNIDLELVSFKPVIDVTGDLKVLKKILKDGEGVHVANEEQQYTARLEDGTIFETKGFDGSVPFEFVTDEGQVISGLDRATSTMKKGELALVTVGPEYGFGSTEVTRDLAVVPSFSTTVYEVEMLDFIREKAPWEMNNHDKIEAAGKKKEQGNILFKAGNYQRAEKRYDKAADYVIEDGNIGDEEQKLAKPLRVSCWLNHAACCLKLNKFHEAINLCSKVLDVESQNVKALYRRANAYMETADLDLSELDIKKALEIDPHNREVKSLYKLLKQLQAEKNKADSKLYTNMFATTGGINKKRKIKEIEASDVTVEAERCESNSGQPSDVKLFDKDP
ncbi:hypothetical protein Sjap_022651 [Stephania japonica]|uniref:peptidylprolyl isomerase n=1 Tax=Stephania japonica TaxID=461633 RepID=A0AAP0HT53_9MAGN